ncbi:hypothetical protein SLS60_002933 [Paraconiothyrium brasiliense]|uniref:Carboxymuconolactone decarboxylase-like domain-containing protein n=1 Tax=Paraconiothyrium brasiliense TaxID=300254 RepID=A0ABR3RV72_9PLEO
MAPTRFPATSLTPSQIADLADAEKAVRDNFGPGIQLKDDEGNLLGPFGPLSYTPTVLAPYLAHIVTIMATPLLTPKERELATLATVSVTKSEFIAYAHKKAGLAAGLSEAQVAEAVQGRAVEGLSEREGMIYEIGLELARCNGRLENDRFEKAVRIMGRDGVSALAQVVGAYLLAAVLVNVADVKAPVE